ncbi:hypothetical protein VT91_22970 [Clostridium sporogenes]|uniref:Uncharacterized protein n=1 Tax=Clostridium botulinum B str. Osaka05 TaxID=1407017 RepID=A0A0S6U458_CLOBO|nr:MULTISPECIES: hypothetical protein [Clostridium]MBE6077762.1 hypothetical protein [Clostridium lundense]EDU36127.1 hypothetical protein CLOSPO_02295 [Clostridium sporogenes ATCC 15579]KRU25355.1 hypothetical protein WG71_29320 [Clostridium sporogenes]KRU28639.1 hypothetical protein VT91_22970 [Clostridium sporogenes]KRU32724.1 hypothetical protein VT28_08910 [Clostridium sporogenes]
MNDIKINIEDLKSQTLIIGNYFQCLEEKKALSLISEFTNDLYNFYSELINVNIQEIDNKILLSLNSCFNGIIEGIKNEDYIYLGDIFIYELWTIMNKVENIFNQLV